MYIYGIPSTSIRTQHIERMNDREEGKKKMTEKRTVALLAITWNALIATEQSRAAETGETRGARNKAD